MHSVKVDALNIFLFTVVCVLFHLHSKTAKYVSLRQEYKTFNVRIKHKKRKYFAKDIGLGSINSITKRRLQYKSTMNVK